MKNKICSLARLALLVLALSLGAPAAHAATPPLVAVVTLNGPATVTNECHSPYADPGAFSGPSALAGGGSYSLALRRDGTVAAWGRNFSGQTTIPAGLSNVVAIAAGDSHSLALRRDGTVAAWGNNGQGQTTIPAGLSNVVAIAKGDLFSLALRSDGTVAAWGAGTINTGTSPNYGQSIIPAGLSNVVAIAGGYSHSLALRSDGTVAAWGDITYGQTTTPAGVSLPVAVSGSVNPNAPGSYVLTYTATNSMGVSGSVTRTVVVRDTLPPVITLLGASPLTNLLSAPFIDPGATALDACGGSFAIITNSTVDVAQFGTYTVSYRSTDSSGNSATNTRTVVVVNNQPVIFNVTGSSQFNGGAFKFSFTNLTGLGFTVLGSTNVALPMAQWTVLGETVENPPGQYQFTDPQATNNATRFYRVRSP